MLKHQSRMRKRSRKYLYELTQDLQECNISDDIGIIVVWTRGKHTVESNTVVYGNSGNYLWMIETVENKPLSMIVTLYQDVKKSKQYNKPIFQSKITKILLKKEKTKQILGIINLDIAQIVGDAVVEKDLILPVEKCIDKKAKLHCILRSIPLDNTKISQSSIIDTSLPFSTTIDDDDDDDNDNYITNSYSETNSLIYNPSKSRIVSAIPREYSFSNVSNNDIYSINAPRIYTSEASSKDAIKSINSKNNLFVSLVKDIDTIDSIVSKRSKSISVLHEECDDSATESQKNSTTRVRGDSIFSSKNSTVLDISILQDEAAGKIVQSAAHEMKPSTTGKVVSNAADKVVSGAADKTISGAADKVVSSAADKVVSSATDKIEPNSSNKTVSNSSEKIISISSDDTTTNIDAREHKIKEKKYQHEIDELHKELLAKDYTIDELRKELIAKDNTIDKLRKELITKENTTDELEKELVEKDNTIKEYKYTLDKKTALLEQELSSKNILHKRLQEQSQAYEQVCKYNSIERSRDDNTTTTSSEEIYKLRKQLKFYIQQLEDSDETLINTQKIYKDINTLFMDEIAMLQEQLNTVNQKKF